MIYEEYFLNYSKRIIGIENHKYSDGKLNRYIYADWAASGRLFKDIETEILIQYAPYYSNIHTKDNEIGNFTNNAYNESKMAIKKHFGATDEYYLFLNGTGMTASIDKLQRILFDTIDIAETVIFISSMEHNSNYLTWLELGVDVQIVKSDSDGNIDIKNLKDLLEENKNKKHKIGSFIACSNLTGISTNWKQVVEVIHGLGGIVFIDFSISAPYIKINLENIDKAKMPDGIFCSTHKFLGGPGAPGILFLKKELYKRKIPTVAGGGTVLWTNPWGGRKYNDDVEQREDSGTPGILQVIKAGLVMKLKEGINFNKMQQREYDIGKYIIKELSQIENVTIYGSLIKKRLPIVSFNIKDLNHSEVVKILSKSYGIQARGGCMCAAIYSHYLLNIDKRESDFIKSNLNNGVTIPGFVRISLSVFNSNKEIEYIVEAIKDIVKNKNKYK